MSKSIEECGGYAFACDSDNEKRQSGMTLRDWLAGMALQAMISSPTIPNLVEITKLPEAAYQLADLMIEQRNK